MINGKKIAFCTGISGQDGSYLAELLLEKDYEVYGMVRRHSDPKYTRIEHILSHPQFHLVFGDLTDQTSLYTLIKEIQPDEIYHLGAMSFVFESWNSPESTNNINGQGTLRILNAMKEYAPHARFYNAASSEMFGNVQETPQTEKTPLNSRSPYGTSKITAFNHTVNYRQSYNLFCCNGILMNHESPRRGIEFVTRKITDGVARIKLGLTTELVLGNIYSKRDWGHAKDYVYAMWLMLQQDQPDDYVIATGELHSIMEFVEESFNVAGITDWQQYVKSDPQFMRPAEVNILLGDYSKAKEKLGWTPTTTFKQLVKEMVLNDINQLQIGIKK